MVNNFNRMKLFNPILCLKGMLNTIYCHLLRIQFPKVMSLRLNGNFQNLESKLSIKYKQSPNNPGRD